MKTRIGRSTVSRAAFVAAALLLVPLSAGCAQGRSGIAARVDAAPDGEVRLHYTSRPGICGWENGISTTESTHRGNWRNGEECVEGPVFVAMEIRDGRVVRARTRVGRGFGTESRGRVTDLGRVPAREAVDYLLALAEREGGRGGKDVIFPATIADSAVTWPGLLRIAKNARADGDVREQAVFWLSQAAGEAATRGLQELVDDDDQDRRVREQAVFALSQRPKDESVPALIRIARSHRDPQIRKTALFWLGQSRDPRAIALFEEILSQ